MCISQAIRLQWIAGFTYHGWHSLVDTQYPHPFWYLKFVPMVAQFESLCLRCGTVFYECNSQRGKTTCHSPYTFQHMPNDTDPCRTQGSAARHVNMTSAYRLLRAVHHNYRRMVHCHWTMDSYWIL